MRIYVAEEVSLGYRGMETRGGLLHRADGNGDECRVPPGSRFYCGIRLTRRFSKLAWLLAVNIVVRNGAENKYILRMGNDAQTSDKSVPRVHNFCKTRYRVSIIARFYFLFLKRRILFLVLRWRVRGNVRRSRYQNASSLVRRFYTWEGESRCHKEDCARRRRREKKKKKKRNGAFRRSASCNREVGGWVLNDGTHAMPSWIRRYGEWRLAEGLWKLNVLRMVFFRKW